MQKVGILPNRMLSNLTGRQLQNEVEITAKALISRKQITGLLDSSHFGTGGRIHFNNCHFLDGIEVGFDSRYQLTFTNCTFESDTIFFDSSSEERSRIWFRRCLFRSDLHLENLTNCSIMIRACELKSDLGMIDLTECSLLLNNQKDEPETIIRGKFDLKFNELSRITIENLNAFRPIKLQGNDVDEITFRRGSFEEISFVSNSVKSIVIDGEREPESEPRSTTINLLDLTGHSGDGNVFISNLLLMKLRLNRITSRGLDILINSSTILGEFDMCYSVPANMVCINVTLRPCFLYFDHSYLGNCVFTNVEWPRGKRLNSHIPPTQQSRNGVLKEAYRQLKHSAVKNSNHIDALAFYRNELDEYTFLAHHEDVKAEDQFILFISSLFSNHGQSFTRPIAWLLGMHLVFFLFAVGLNYNGFYFTTDHEWSATADLVGSYFYLLNPVHKLPDASGGMLILDFFMRLSSGFFIYHIIRASRKFAKV